MNNETSRKVLIVSASIGTGHMQAARAIEEYWKEKEPQASITHVDFLDTETMSVEHLIKGTYIKMIDVFPMLYDMIYRFPSFPDMITDIITLNTITKKITQIDTVVDM